MTDIEELVRESLRTAPPVAPSSSDPLGLVSRRVRRARALWGGGAAAVIAVVVAAVVVPLSLRDSAGERLVPTRPSPTASPVARHGVTTWDKMAVAVAAGDGYLWEVRRDPAANDGSGFLVKVDPATHESLQQWDVRAPFDFMTYGLGHAWVWGGGDGGYPDGLLQTFDVSTSDGCPCTSTGYHGAGFGDVTFLGGHAWATAGSQVWEMAPGGGRLWSHSFGPGSAPGRVVAVGGRLFVQLSPTSMQQLIPEGDGVGARLGVTSMVSDAVEVLLGVQGTDMLLVSTGRDVEQWRRYGADVVGNAVLESGVGHVATLPSGDLVVSTLGFEDGTVQPALWFVSRGPDGLLCPACAVGKIVDDVSVVSLVANPAGGVDYVLDDGTAGHWQP